MIIKQRGRSNNKSSLFANIPDTSCVTTTTNAAASEESNSSSFSPSSSFDHGNSQNNNYIGDRDNVVNQFSHSSFSSFPPRLTTSRTNPANANVNTNTDSTGNDNENDNDNENTNTNTNTNTNDINFSTELSSSSSQAIPSSSSSSSSSTRSSPIPIEFEKAGKDANNSHEKETEYVKFEKKNNHHHEQKKNSIYYLQKIVILLILSIGVSFITIFTQGIMDLMTYRRYFGNAPIPKSPSHGLIVAHSKEFYQSRNNIDHNNNKAYQDDYYMYNENDDNKNDGRKRYMFKVFHSLKPSHIQHIEEGKILQEQTPVPNETQKQQPPLRLLVIGDSIARGVGQTYNSSPVLPQSIGKHLSRHMNNRAVYWTSMAEPGASTKWLSDLVGEEVNRMKKTRRQKQQQLKDDDEEGKKEDSLTDAGSSSSNSKSSLTSKAPTGPFVSLKEFRERHISSSKSIYSITKDEWISNLEYHEQLYAQNPFGNYDIIIVMSGLNDIKRILVPFLLDDEVVNKEDDDIVDYQNHHIKIDGKERGFAADMQRLIELLSMNQNLDDMDSDYHVTKAITCQNETERTCLLSSYQGELEQDRIENDEQHQQQQQQQPPLIVFPRFPTNANPVKMGALLRKIAIQLCSMMDEVKHRIANQYENVISPDAPSFVEFAHEYLSREMKNSDNLSGDYSRKLVSNENEVMVNLLYMSVEECKKKEDDMLHFYSQRNASDFCVDSPLGQLFAPDGLHPSDLGYDNFGELLAKNILKKWGHDR